jgi:cytochrome c peroxidase
MTKRIGLGFLLVVATSCERISVTDPDPAPTLDAQLRSLTEFWGAIPIAPMPAQPAALVDLGQSLFFDKELSGNRDVSCASCHDPLSQMTDGLTLAVGTGGSGLGTDRTPGAGRQFVARNAPTLLNQGLGFVYTLWDGRVNEEWQPQGGFKAPAGIVFPAGLKNLLAAQAMLPVLSRVEMRGNVGDQDVFGASNELALYADSSAPAIWQSVMTRLLAIQAYAAKFSAAYPGTPQGSLGFQHAANALAAFQMQTLTFTSSPFDRWLARDNRALTDEQKRGGILFFGKAQCASCHSGAMLGGQQFANIGIPQLGPGVGTAAPLDLGRAEHISQSLGSEFYRFHFRAPALRNVELTSPYMHNGAYRTLESVVKHYTNADSALRNYDATQLPPALQSTVRRDASTLSSLLLNLDFRLRDRNITLTTTEQTKLVAFLKALTDPAARNLAHAVPVSVPSGLSVRD